MTTPAIVRGSALLLGITALASFSHGQNAPPKLHLIAELPTQLVRISRPAEDEAVLTFAVGPWHSPLDAGDEVRFVDPATGQHCCVAHLMHGTRPDGAAGLAHAKARFSDSATLATLLERLRRVDAAGESLRATIVTGFDAANGDDPRDFVELRDQQGRRLIATSISPECSMTLRFRERIDMASLAALQVLQVGETDDPATTTNRVPMRICQLDESQTVFQLKAPLGLAFTDPMRDAAQKQAERDPAVPHAHYVLRLNGGPSGVRTATGATLPQTMEMPLAIDPKAENNQVSWHIYPDPTPNPR